MAAQIVSGIGFLGAGLIFVRRDAVRGFVIDDLAGETANDRSGGSADQGKDDWPAMVAVTMHVHGRRPVTELASVLTELDLVDAVVAANHQATDE